MKKSDPLYKDLKPAIAASEDASANSLDFSKPCIETNVVFPAFASLPTVLPKVALSEVTSKISSMI